MGFDRRGVMPSYAYYIFTYDTYKIVSISDF